MKKILIVLVGGTICTEVKGNLRTINKDAGSLLTNYFYQSHPEYSDTVDLFEESQNFQILSENMTLEKWNVLVGYFAGIYDRLDRYSGIIIAHGTDTLAFSSSMFSLLLSDTPVPVFFVASNEPLSSPASNGNENFKTAVECILNGIDPGVYAAYKNPEDEQMYIHRGSRLIQCSNYDENFYSKDSVKANCISNRSVKEINSKLAVKKDAKHNGLLSAVSSRPLSSCVLYIQPYVGLNYEAYDYSRFKAVFHGAYHSGTACVEQTASSKEYSEHSVLKMLDICDAKNVDVYFSPSVLDGEIYDSVQLIADHKTSNGTTAQFVYGMTNETTYCKLLIAYSLGYSRAETVDFLRESISGETAYCL